MSNITKKTAQSGWFTVLVPDPAGKEIIPGKPGKWTKAEVKTVTTYSTNNGSPVPNSAVMELYFKKYGGAFNISANEYLIGSLKPNEKLKLNANGLNPDILGAAAQKSFSNDTWNNNSAIINSTIYLLKTNSAKEYANNPTVENTPLDNSSISILLGTNPKASPEPPGGAPGTTGGAPGTTGGDPGSGSTGGSSTPSFTPEQSENTKKLISTSVKARTTYNETLKYPESYEGNDYTVIKMLRYVADPNLSLGGNPEVETTEQGDSEAVTNLSLTRFSERKEEILATINLPIPSNLIDANPVNWESGDLGPLRAYGVTAAANILNSGNFSTGVGNEVGRAARTIQANGESARTILNASIIGAVLGMSGNDILTRSTGAILNPNTELLFRGPQLRTWNFSFKMTPRNDKEAKTIRKIIRWLKQGSSVKRAGNGIFLASPNVFKIEFKHVRHDGKNVTDSIEDHPFLPRIKPSALQSISVNYMPDGSYMTYGDGSMVGYEMTLNFQEIEPIFDEDYDKLDEQGPDTTIGF